MSITDRQKQKESRYNPLLSSSITKKSPNKQLLSTSPIKVKDFFTNPLHKIKQPAFVQVGFNHSTLSTFIKAFTCKYNTKYLSFSMIKSFIKKFTDNDPRLMSSYQQFFIKNFMIIQQQDININQRNKRKNSPVKNLESSAISYTPSMNLNLNLNMNLKPNIESGLIDIQQFMEFFLKEQKYQLQQLSQKNIKNLYYDLQPLTVQGILQKCQQLGSPISQQQAKRIVQMGSYGLTGKKGQILKEEDFIKIMKM